MDLFPSLQQILLILADNASGLSRTLSLHIPDLFHLNRIEIDFSFTISLKGMNIEQVHDSFKRITISYQSCLRTVGHREIITD